MEYHFTICTYGCKVFINVTVKNVASLPVV